MEAGDESWMGQEDEPLIGFPWRAGVQATSLGVWMWSQPFWVQTAEGKVAVFLVDIEGCMGIGRNNIKLSAFSLLLSSFQIVNIPSRINEPLLDYLEVSVRLWAQWEQAARREPRSPGSLLQPTSSRSPLRGPRSKTELGSTCDDCE
uniref:Guanylate-binding protein N-terminal domain-containing protein n=1 Tax=Sphenodon punctatus TaxID=8508 RepID=A0A8D0L4Y2_SPHPU